MLTGDIRKVHIFRFDMGQDLLDALQNAIQEAGIRQGVILNGIGSLVTYHVHVVGRKQRPVPNIYMQDERGMDLVAAQGYIIDGRVHAHITISDSETAIGGHLEPGCEVYTFAIITVAELTDTALTGIDDVLWTTWTSREMDRSL